MKQEYILRCSTHDNIYIDQFELSDEEFKTINYVFTIINQRLKEDRIRFELIGNSKINIIKGDIKDFIKELQYNSTNYTGLESSVATNYVINRLKDIIK